MAEACPLVVSYPLLLLGIEHSISCTTTESPPRPILNSVDPGSEMWSSNGVHSENALWALGTVQKNQKIDLQKKEEEEEKLLKRLKKPDMACHWS